MSDTIYTVIGGLAVPAIIGLWRWLVKRAKKKKTERKQEIEAIRRGLVALLKDRLYQAYLFHSSKGKADIDAREIVMEMYREYKNLGGNGVMDDLYKKFLALPTK